MTLGISVLIVYLLLMAWHALSGLVRSRDAVEYHVAGRTLPGVVVGLSFFATFLSTNSFIGLAGRSATWGLSTYAIGAFFVGFAWISWRFVAPRLRHETERLDALTLPEFFGATYRSDPYRRLSAVIVIVAAIPYLQAVFKGGSLVMMNLTGLGIVPALLLTWGVVVAYTLVGGFHAVANTDAVQALLMILAAVVLPVGLIAAQGGLDATLDATTAVLNVERGDLFSLAPIGTIIGMGCAGGFKMMAEPRQLSRFFAIDPGEIRRARRVTTVALSLSYLLLLPLGLLAVGFYGEVPDDPDQLVPRMLADPNLLPPWFGAISLAALLGAAMSSIDSALLVVGGTVWRDLLRRPGDPTGVHEVAATRTIIFVFSLLPPFLVLHDSRQILDLTTFAGALYGAAFLPALLFALYRPATPAAAAWTSTLVGIVTVLTWKTVTLAIAPPLALLHEVIAGAIAATIPLLLSAMFRRG